jgi:hypothetical protein
MTSSEISKLRLRNQQVSGNSFTSAGQLLQWMGAMQAQDLIMAKWALGLRLPGTTEKQIESAIESGEIIRTHLMRPTWHFAAAGDVDWIMDLTAPQIKSQMKSSDLYYGLTPDVITKCNKVLEKTLNEEQQVSREILVNALNKANIVTTENRAAHILLRAELDKVICSGGLKNNRTTYVLYGNRITSRAKISHETALARLAERYFQSHSPATLQDFIWWSGLRVKDASAGLHEIKSGLMSETIDSQIYWWSENNIAKTALSNTVYLLPAYDEFIISYKDRSAALEWEHINRAISRNGIFKPVIVINNKVSGIWKKTLLKDKLMIEISFFRPYNDKELKAIEKATKWYGQFAGRDVEVVFGKG